MSLHFLIIISPSFSLSHSLSLSFSTSISLPLSLFPLSFSLSLSLAHMSVFLHYLFQNKDPKYLVSILYDNYITCSPSLIPVIHSLASFLLLVFLFGGSQLSEPLQGIRTETERIGNNVDVLFPNISKSLRIIIAL